MPCEPCLLLLSCSTLSALFQDEARVGWFVLPNKGLQPDWAAFQAPFCFLILKRSVAETSATLIQMSRQVPFAQTWEFGMGNT